MQLAQELSILCNGKMIEELVSINGGTLGKQEKQKKFNKKLKAFVDSSKFFKSKAEFEASLPQSGSLAYVTLIHDNIVARVLTRSNNSPIFRMLTEQAKTERLIMQVKTDSELHDETGKTTVTKNDFQILLPDGLNFSFLEPVPSTIGSGTNLPDNTQELAEEYVKFVGLRDLLDEARLTGVKSFKPKSKIVVADTSYAVVNQVLATSSISAADASKRLNEGISNLEKSDSKEQGAMLELAQLREAQRAVAEAEKEGQTSFSTEKAVTERKYDALLQTLSGSSMTLFEADKIVSNKTQELSAEIMRIAPRVKYALVGDRWADISHLSTASITKSRVGDDAIYVFENDCHLSFPFQIADLRVVEQQTVGYLPGEIAHVNNTQPGEMKTRVTRRLKRTETFESLITEDEVVRETDTQSTEKFGFEKEASQVQEEEESWNVNASVSGQYGPVKASVNAGYESSSSLTNSNSSAQTYAKEVVRTVVDRLTSKVKSERSTKSIEEFEETVTHVIDNKENDDPKSYVYRWLNKLTRATLKNYGKRLMFQLDIAHPSHYHISRSILERTTCSTTHRSSAVDYRGCDFRRAHQDHP